MVPKVFEPLKFDCSLTVPTIPGRTTKIADPNQTASETLTSRLIRVSSTICFRSPNNGKRQDTITLVLRSFHKIINKEEKFKINKGNNMQYRLNMDLFPAVFFIAFAFDNETYTRTGGGGVVLSKLPVLGRPTNYLV